MARLVYVPVVHSIAEMGSAAEAYRAAFAARYGERKLAERSTEFDAIWRAIGEGIRSLRLDLKHVKLYQDSLPVCGHERALVHQIWPPRAVETISSWRPSPTAALRLSARNRLRCCSMNTGSCSRLNAPKRRRPLFSMHATSLSQVASTRRSANGSDRHLVHRRAAPRCKVPAQANLGRIPRGSQVLTRTKSSGEFHAQRSQGSQRATDNREKLRLTVVEARREDIGRGIVRLDPETLKEIGGSPGDVLEIEGRTTTVAKAMPTFKELRGQQVIQLDGVGRTNAGVALGQKVAIDKVVPCGRPSFGAYATGRRAPCMMTRSNTLLAASTDWP